jgi:plastocyanin
MGTCGRAIAAGLLGVAVVVLPGLAGAQAPGATVTAADFSFSGGDGSKPAAVTIAPGGTVSFAYPAGASQHDVHFSGPAPDACTGSSAQVGAAPTPAAPGWSASCTFTAPGTYAFFCDVHHGMTGTVAVVAATPPVTQTTTVPTQPADTTPTTSSTPSTPSSPSTSSTPTYPTAPAANKPSTPTAAKAPAATHLVATAVQHGTTVRATIAIARGGSSLTATLLGPARLGSVSRHRLAAGSLRLSVGLNAAGRRALRAKHRMRLTLRVAVTGPAGATTALTRPVLLKP